MMVRWVRGGSAVVGAGVARVRAKQCSSNPSALPHMDSHYDK